MLRGRRLRGAERSDQVLCGHLSPRVCIVSRGVSLPGGVLQLALVVGALGVVFGDIGTSPIYTIQTVFNPDDPHPVPATTDNIYGIVSLIFWSVTLIVTVTYVLLAM